MRHPYTKENAKIGAFPAYQQATGKHQPEADLSTEGEQVMTN